MEVAGSRSKVLADDFRYSPQTARFQRSSKTMLLWNLTATAVARAGDGRHWWRQTGATPYPSFFSLATSLPGKTTFPLLKKDSKRMGYWQYGAL